MTGSFDINTFLRRSRLFEDLTCQSISDIIIPTKTDRVRYPLTIKLL